MLRIQIQDQLLLSIYARHRIAHDLKFEDEHYFSRFFKKHTGFSPRAYRQEHKDIK
ncbi:MAG: hypothetical protein COA79_13885 [Planctomycetota bacterium]|nr:MAG: hypothetical protein COA79_13885 [Planctomycetota bacterium]